MPSKYLQSFILFHHDWVASGWENPIHLLSCVSFSQPLPTERVASEVAWSPQKKAVDRFVSSQSQESLMNSRNLAYLLVCLSVHAATLSFSSSTYLVLAIRDRGLLGTKTTKAHTHRVTHTFSQTFQRTTHTPEQRVTHTFERRHTHQHTKADKPAKCRHNWGPRTSDACIHEI